MSPIVHTHSFRVRYGETDQMGVVYHANYLNWFEMGRTELIRSAQLSYRQLEEKGVLLPLTDAVLTYKKPARYDDLLEVRTIVEEITPVRLTFRYEICRMPDDELLVWGKTMHVFTTKGLKPIRLSRAEPDLYRWLEMQHRGDETR